MADFVVEDEKRIDGGGVVAVGKLEGESAFRESSRVVIRDRIIFSVNLVGTRGREIGR